MVSKINKYYECTYIYWEKCNFVGYWRFISLNQVVVFS